MAIAQTRFGKYRLLRRIAAGGMAEIYLGIQEGPHGFQKTIVLKLILEQHSAVDAFVQMFLDEARLAANLEHQNIVRLYDFGEHEGRYFLTMEYLPGEDLGSVMQMLKRSGRAMPIDIACQLMISACAGLHVAHELTDNRGQPLKIVHRDVSLSNLMLTYQGVLKVLDFGIAHAESNVVQTDAGTVKGKLAYSSPEQLTGVPIDRRSDIFSLGIVLHEVLSGQKLFKREGDLATMNAVLYSEIIPPSFLRPEVPADLDRIVLRALERDVTKRYQTMVELSDELGVVLTSLGTPSGERVRADFLLNLFGVERRDQKLRVEDPEAMADVAKGSDSGLSPVRSSVRLPEAQLPLVVAELEVPPKRARWPWVGVGLLTMVVAGVVATRVLEPKPPPEPVATTPVVAVVAPAAVVVAPVVAAEPDAAVPEPVVEAPKPVEPKPVTAAKQRRGRLTLDTQPWTEVFLNGRKLGDTPLVDVKLPVGVQSFTLVNEAKSVHSVVEIEIVENKSTVKRLKF